MMLPLWCLPSSQALGSFPRLSPLQGLEEQYPNGIPELDPEEDFRVEEPEALAAAEKLGSLRARLRRNAVYQV